MASYLPPFGDGYKICKLLFLLNNLNLSFANLLAMFRDRLNFPHIYISEPSLSRDLLLTIFTLEVSKSIQFSMRRYYTPVISFHAYLLEFYE